MTNEQWYLVISALRGGDITIENVCQSFQVSRKEIQTQINEIPAPNITVPRRTYTRALALEGIEVTAITAPELRLLGVRLKDLQAKKVGQVELPCATELVSLRGQIELKYTSIYNIHQIPGDVLVHLWRLRPFRGDREVRFNDCFFMQLLQKRVTHLLSTRRHSRHWSEIQLNKVYLKRLREQYDGSGEEAKVLLRLKIVESAKD